MPQETISEYLDPYRFPRMAFGLKANSTLNRITLTPSNANPGETLCIEIPKLSENTVIVPGSMFLLFDLTISDHENITVVNNISRSLVKRQRVVFGGESLQDTTNYDLFQTYHDLLLHHKTFTFSKPNDSVINEHINVPRRSMTGILLLFTENPTAGERDSEKFVNPDI